MSSQHTWHISVRCRQCIFRNEKDLACDYLFVTGHRRVCKPDECDKFLDRRTHLRTSNNTIVETPFKESNEEQEGLFFELYSKGLTDVDIGLAVGCPKGRVTRWRQRLGLPTQKSLRKSIEETSNGLEDNSI